MMAQEETVVQQSEPVKEILVLIQTEGKGLLQKIFTGIEASDLLWVEVNELNGTEKGESLLVHHFRDAKKEKDGT